MSEPVLSTDDLIDSNLNLRIFIPTRLAKADRVGACGGIAIITT